MTSKAEETASVMENKADRQGRLSSSTQHPRPLPPTPAARKKLLSRHLCRMYPQAPSTPSWHCQLRRVSRSKRLDHTSDESLEIAYDFDEKRAGSQCFLECRYNENDNGKQALHLRVYQLEKGIIAPCLYEFRFPNYDYLLDLHVFESTRTLELRKKPIDPSSSVDTCRWILDCRSDEKWMPVARALIKRLENVTRELPKEWFSYRNFALQAQSASLSADESGSRTLEHELPDGTKWKFTGFLASPGFQQVLRRESKTVDERGSPMPSDTRKQKKAAAKQAKQDRRRASRLEARQDKFKTPIAGSHDMDDDAKSDAENEVAFESVIRADDNLLEMKTVDGLTYARVQRSAEWEPACNFSGEALKACIDAQWNTARGKAELLKKVAEGEN